MVRVWHTRAARVVLGLGIFAGTVYSRADYADGWIIEEPTTQGESESRLQRLVTKNIELAREKRVCVCLPFAMIPLVIVNPIYLFLR